MRPLPLETGSSFPALEPDKGTLGSGGRDGIQSDSVRSVHALDRFLDRGGFVRREDVDELAFRICASDRWREIFMAEQSTVDTRGLALAASARMILEQIARL